MRNGSLIDDVDFGKQILFPNPMIRRMLNLAGAGENDIFYDLGCGWGQNLIIASTEFKVRESVGIETDPSRARVARDRIKKFRHSRNAKIIKAGIDDVLNGKRDVGLKKATIVFFGLPNEKGDIARFNRRLRKDCKLIYYFVNGVFPEIKPDLIDYPFYLSKKPFAEPGDELDWLRSIIKKEESNLSLGQPEEEELWDEFYHDLNIEIGEGSGEVGDEYRQRLGEFLAQKS